MFDRLAGALQYQYTARHCAISETSAISNLTLRISAKCSFTGIYLLNILLGT